MQQTQKKERSRRKIKSPFIWHWVLLILVCGSLLVYGVSALTGQWLSSNVRFDGVNPTPTPIPTTSFSVQRFGYYAGLKLTILNAQYAPYFPDDHIRPGTGVVRLNMQVQNPGSEQIKVVYYESLRLIAKDMDPLVPTNLKLSAGPEPGKDEKGWIDFAVSKPVQLDALMLQFGNTRTQESKVSVPFKGDYDPNSSADQTAPQNLSFDYLFLKGKPARSYVLKYHLDSIQIRYAYQGVQCHEGQQYYIFNFTIDNPSGGEIVPEAAYNYIRWNMNNYDQTPVDSTIPSNIGGNARGVKGHVVFTAPAGLHTFNLIFLRQYGGQRDSYWLNA